MLGEWFGPLTMEDVAAQGPDSPSLFIAFYDLVHHRPSAFVADTKEGFEVMSYDAFADDKDERSAKLARAFNSLSPEDQALLGNLANLGCARSASAS